METITRKIPDFDGNFFLFGPRGTGKSTWLVRKYSKALYIDLLHPKNFRIYSSKPERLEDITKGSPNKKTIIIDEVQKVPELLSVVHRLIEQDKSLKFILTGSSSRKLKRSGIDLLAGRAIIKNCHPFLASEISDYFNLSENLEIGMLPLVLGSKNPVSTLNSYVGLYIQEEIKAEGFVRNIGNFSRFLETISFSQSSLLNISEIAREAAVKRKTVENYISILEDLMLSFRLPVFSKKAKRHLVKQSKFYYFDCGVYKSIRPSGPLDLPEEINGAALEGLVAQHLRAWNDYSESKNEMFFWRTKSGMEVDFIIYGKEFTAIEVKHSDKIRNRDLKGLNAFGKDYPNAELLFLYRGTERLKIGNVLCLPCEFFFKNLIPNKKIIT